MAGVTGSDARPAARAMMSVQPPSSFVEVYGDSITNHNLLSRRNLNITGLQAMDIRTCKPNGQPWDFSKRSDRKEARQMIKDSNPDWVVGAPPCTAFSIWNHGMNYRKMEPTKVKQLLKA